MHRHLSRKTSSVRIELLAALGILHSFKIYALDLVRRDREPAVRASQESVVPFVSPSLLRSGVEGTSCPISVEHGYRSMSVMIP